MQLDKLEDWRSQLEQADEYGLFFDSSTVREMIKVIEKQQHEIESWKGFVKTHNDNGKKLASKVESYEKAIESNKVCGKCNSEIRKILNKESVCWRCERKVEQCICHHYPNRR